MSAPPLPPDSDPVAATRRLPAAGAGRHAGTTIQGPDTMKEPVPFFDPKDLRPHPPLYRPTLRTRNVCLSPADWQALGDALQQAYPAGIYVRDTTWQEQNSTGLPQDTPVDHLCGYLETEGTMPFEIEMCLDPDWTVEHWPAKEGAGITWHRNRMPFPFVMFRPGNGILPARPPAPECIASGEIHVYCEHQNKDHLAFARRFYRLFGRFAGNRNQRIKSYWEKSRGRITLSEKGSDMWLGHDAIRWVREKPDRELYDQTNMAGFRPAET